MKRSRLLLCAAIVLNATPAFAQLPETSMEIDLSDTAFVITDPQNDFLHPDSAAWELVGVNGTM